MLINSNLKLWLGIDRNLLVLDLELVSTSKNWWEFKLTHLEVRLEFSILKEKQNLDKFMSTRSQTDFS